jgi:hypothetical protein
MAKVKQQNPAKKQPAKLGGLLSGKHLKKK